MLEIHTEAFYWVAVPLSEMMLLWCAISALTSLVRFAYDRMRKTFNDL